MVHAEHGSNVVLKQKTLHQRGEDIMAQQVLPFQYEIERAATKLTALGGLPLFEELGQALGIYESIRTHLTVRPDQGYTDEEVVLSLMHLQLAGGDKIEDLLVFTKDVGFAEFSKRMHEYRMSRAERRRVYLRWRKRRVQEHPSPSSAFRYLEKYHDFDIEKKRIAANEAGIKAYIPELTEHLKELSRVNRDLVRSIAIQRQDITTATLDVDATLIPTQKERAFYCYEGYQAYQPLNVWWSELGLMLYSEFRDGNVPAGYEALRVIEQAIEMLPDWIEKVRLRLDTAGYEHELMRWCEDPERRPEHLRRFGKIEFAISCEVNESFRTAVREIAEGEWQELHAKRNKKVIGIRGQYAEVCYVPNKIAHSKKGQSYRYLATREIIRQMELPGMEPAPIDEKLHPEKLAGVTYKVFGMVSNIHEMDGEELIFWQHERCGKSEEAHLILKSDLGGGSMPSALFGVNAAWWWITILAYNLIAAFKLLVLPERFKTSRLKAIRLWLINIPGKIVEHARRFIIKICNGHPTAELLYLARDRIAALQPYFGST